MSFSESDLPDLSGRTALVTGATGGLGLEMARMLSGAGAHVTLAGRNPSKGARALALLREIQPDAELAFEPVDLADLVSVSDLGARLRDKGDRIDILINNAGLMTPPDRKVTRDGFELQFGTNHVGHFALTRELLPLLRSADAPRVVTISSGIAAMGKIDFDDLQSEREYRPVAAYAQSKLANLLFTRELQRRSDLNGWGLLSTAAHPGHARTDLIANGQGEPQGPKRWMIAFIQAVASHDAKGGAMPAMMAATAADVEPMDYFGPSRMFQQKGPPIRVKIPAGALDEETARRLWEVSEELISTALAGRHSTEYGPLQEKAVNQ